LITQQVNSKARGSTHSSLTAEIQSYKVIIHVTSKNECQLNEGMHNPHMLKLAGMGHRVDIAS